ncbi:hypothetical protein [Schleiferilactobacillus shenzhenensis]|uniref:Uncharacterized protein n=1 Tax=Schleiferilactobacillus shenzhenensis LY-73 TaxID=1231336 RepID=U4TL93_9LACO|nr:hypothetical protein [Schleiferilactobacillus shenzhenensis]ERL64165.1 hypothetical protein L248_1530 [Schleiferilactobacillus shenzhenensis LY-73]
MPRKQRFVVTVVIVFGMASIMSLIGNVLATGWNAVTWRSWLVWWIPTVVVAFLYNWFVAYHVTQWFIHRATRHVNDPTEVQRRSKGVTSRVMLLIMCVTMSTFGLLIGGAFAHIGFTALLWVWLRSLVIAFFVRGLLVKPVAFYVQRRFFPLPVA